MATQITRWSPDTCNCVIEYSWDDTTPENNRTLTPHNVVQRCPAHQVLANTPTTIFNTLMEENPRKNLSLDEILQNAPSTAWFDVDANGNRSFKNGININWTWSGTAPNRVLTLIFSGVTLTNQQKTTLQTRLNTRFGNGKVTIL